MSASFESVETTGLAGLVGPMIAAPAGSIEVRDEGTGRRWLVEFGAFRLAQHPVTRALYEAVMGIAPVCPGGPRAPVTEVSWLDAIGFCNALSRVTGRTPCYTIGEDREGREVVCAWTTDGYRLPSEAEWEYACRAGSREVRYGDLDAIAWHRGNSGGAVHAVATRAANGWGFHDMIGNVWEWCWDVFDAEVYGPYRVFRGGGWCDEARACRASCRRKSHPTYRIDDLGFRVARSGWAAVSATPRNDETTR